MIDLPSNAERRQSRMALRSCGRFASRILTTAAADVDDDDDDDGENNDNGNAQDGATRREATRRMVER